MAADEELLFRQLPHSLEAEQAVLGSMLIDANCVKDVMEKLRPEDFYLRQNREIFGTIQSMFLFNRPIDALTVFGEMEKNGVGDASTTRAYLAELMEVTPTSANVLEYADIVLDKSLLRAVATAAGEITALVQDGGGAASAVLEAAEQKIYAVRRGRSAQDMERIGPVLQGVMEHLAELTASGGKTQPGLPSGFSDIDDRTSGFGTGDLVLLAARPGMGKTSLALNIATNVAKTGGAVAIFSLEMSKEQLVTRVLSREAAVENQRLLTGNLRESDWVKIAEASSVLSPLDVRIDDNPLLTVADMNAKCRRIEGLRLVVIDYLQLMTSAGGDNGKRVESRQQAVSDMSRMLKIMAKELGVPVLCLSQLSRANEKREDKRPVLSDLRDSGAIEQDADIVMFIYRDDYYKDDSERRNIAECIIAKNRHGSTGRINLTWTPELTSFTPFEGRYEEDEW